MSRTVGSASAPSKMPMAVIPTCTVEMTRTGSSISRSAARAPAEPASARGASAARRAVTTVYSPITKKAFAATSASTAMTLSKSDIPHTLRRAPPRGERTAHGEGNHSSQHASRRQHMSEPGTGGNTGGIGLGGILVIVGIVLMIVWSFWIGLIITLIGLVAFGGFAKGKWY